MSRAKQIIGSTLVGAFVFAAIDGGVFAYRFSQSFPPEHEEVLRRILVYNLMLDTTFAALLGALAGLMVARFRTSPIFAILIGSLLGVLLPLAVVGFRIAVSDGISFNYLFEGYGGLEPFLRFYLIKGIATGLFGAIAGLAASLFVKATTPPPGPPLDSPPPPPLIY